MYSSWRIQASATNAYFNNLEFTITVNFTTNDSAGLLFVLSLRAMLSVNFLGMYDKVLN